MIVSFMSLFWHLRRSLRRLRWVWAFGGVFNLSLGWSPLISVVSLVGLFSSHCSDNAFASMSCADDSKGVTVWCGVARRPCFALTTAQLAASVPCYDFEIPSYRRRENLHGEYGAIIIFCAVAVRRPQWLGSVWPHVNSNMTSYSHLMFNIRHQGRNLIVVISIRALGGTCFESLIITDLRKCVIYHYMSIVTTRELRISK